MGWLERIVEWWMKNRCDDCGRKLICPKCGSTNVTPQGWAGQNHRHRCKECGHEEWL